MNKEGLRNFASRAAFAGALVGLAHAPAIVDTQSNNGRIDTHIVALSPDIHPVYAAESPKPSQSLLPVRGTEKSPSASPSVSPTPLSNEPNINLGTIGEAMMIFGAACALAVATGVLGRGGRRSR